MGWTRKAKLKWQRKASRQRYPSVMLMNGTYDRHGTFKLDTWSAEDWTGSRHRSRRYVNHQRRQAAKLMIAHELMQDAEWQEELWEIYADEHWYDDEPMDYFEDEFIEWEDIYPKDPEEDDYGYDYRYDVYYGFDVY